MGGRFPRVARAALGVIGMAVAVSLALPAAPAAAHNSLTGSNPKNGARVADAPEKIELRFLAKANPDTTKITVTGPDDVPALGGPPTFSGSRVSIPFEPGAAGLYIVGYEVGSSDGHQIKGEVRFTLTAGTPAEPPSSAPAEPTAEPSTPASSAAAEPTTPAATPVAAEAEGGDGGGAGWLWGLGGLVVVAGLAAGFLLRRRSRS